MKQELITCRLNEIDGFVINEVYSNEVYNIKKYIKHQISNFVDIGAHIGSFTLKMHYQAPNANGYAYEPDKDNFYLLQLNTIDKPNLHVFNSAVYGSLKPSKLTNNVLNKHHIIVYDYVDSGNELDINTVNIKELQEKIGKIDLIKIDCEGGEHSIFEEIDFSKIGYMLCEFHTEKMHHNPNFKPFYKWVIEIEKYMKIIYREKTTEDTFNFVAINEEYWNNYEIF